VNTTFDALVLTCEHGGNDVPQAYAALFTGAQAVLATHRGWDIGALALAQELATQLEAPLYFSKTTRLLIDPNRSLHVKSVWSEWTRELDSAAKAELAQRYYHPYRTSVEQQLTQLVTQGKCVLHLSSRRSSMAKRATLMSAFCMTPSARMKHNWRVPWWQQCRPQTKRYGCARIILTLATPTASPPIYAKSLPPLTTRA
jgi:hypothetical protein